MKNYGITYCEESENELIVLLDRISTIIENGEILLLETRDGGVGKNEILFTKETKNIGEC